jgi:hypothetical protein
MAWTQQSLAEHFFAAAETRAKNDGRHFGDGADKDLHELVFTGARTLLATTKPDDIDAAVAAATRGIEGLIDEAISNAHRLPGYDPQRLGEATYFPARLRFCPFPPFC